MGKRTYIRHTWKGKATLTTWTQTRCLRCQRFLSNKQIKYCKRCSELITKIKHQIDSKLYRVRHKKKVIQDREDQGRSVLDE
jgi:hypothetical protein